MVPAIATFLFSLFCFAPSPPAGLDLPTVLVCTGPVAYAYHNYVDCRGLANCEYKIVEMPEDSAKINRNQCKICKRHGKRI